MKVAYVTGEYPRATDTFIQREVSGLRDKGIEVDTFSIREPDSTEFVGPEQVAEHKNTTYILPANPWKLLRAHVSLLTSAPKQYLKGCKLAWETRQSGIKGHLYQLFYLVEAGLLAQDLKDRGIQHLHNHFGSSSGSVAMLATELGGLTFSFTLHGSYIFFEPHRWRLDKKIEKSLFVSCISHFCRSQGMMFSAPQHWERMHVIHCGIDPALFEPVSRPETGKNLLYVGRLAAGKGLPLLFESMLELSQSHPDIHLTVVGDGADRKNLEAAVASKKLQQQVTFVGYQSQSQVRERLKSADIFVLPSLSEGVPVVLMEAMAASVPVVATRVGGIAELVEDGVGGRIATPADSHSLTECLADLLGNPQRRQAMGVAGREKVQTEFNIHHEVNRLHQVFTAALSGQPVETRPELPSVGAASAQSTAVATSEKTSDKVAVAPTPATV